MVGEIQPDRLGPRCTPGLPGARRRDPQPRGEDVRAAAPRWPRPSLTVKAQNSPRWRQPPGWLWCSSPPLPEPAADGEGPPVSGSGAARCYPRFRGAPSCRFSLDAVLGHEVEAARSSALNRLPAFDWQIHVRGRMEAGRNFWRAGI